MACKGCINDLLDNQTRIRGDYKPQSKIYNAKISSELLNVQLFDKKYTGDFNKDNQTPYVIGGIPDSYGRADKAAPNLPQTLYIN